MTDRITLAVRYLEPAGGGAQSEATVGFTLAKVDGIWLVDDYTYPEARTVG